MSTLFCKKLLIFFTYFVDYFFLTIFHSFLSSAGAWKTSINTSFSPLFPCSEHICCSNYFVNL